MNRVVFRGLSFHIMNKLNLNSFSGLQLNFPSKFCRYSDDSKNSFKPKGGVYKVFQDEESPIILDIEEERAVIQKSRIVGEPWDEFYGINLKRGVNGVFEIEDLVDVVRKNRATNIFVVKVPEIINYVDYLVIVSCRSKRHIYALTEFVLKVFKKKRYSSDRMPPAVGQNTSDWVALDLGNIALHMMTNPMREMYDLETLWSVGSKFDDLSKTTVSSILEILQKHSTSLDYFKPANNLS